MRRRPWSFFLPLSSIIAYRVKKSFNTVGVKGAQTSQPVLQEPTRPHCSKNPERTQQETPAYFFDTSIQAQLLKSSPRPILKTRDCVQPSQHRVIRFP